MANTLKKTLALLQLVTLVCCITNADNKQGLKAKDVDAEDNQDDLEPQETGWLFNPLQEKTRTLEYLKDKVFYPFTALKSPSTPHGAGYPVYTPGVSNYYPNYAGSYPTYSFGGSSSYYPSARPKQHTYYNPLYSSYKKSYPTYPTKTWTNKNYFSAGGYQVGTYSPDCHYPPTTQSVPSTTLSTPTYTTGTPLYYYYSSVSPSQTYGTAAYSVGVKSAVSVLSSQTQPSYSSQSHPSYISQTPKNAYVWKVSSSPQYLVDSSQTYGTAPSMPSWAGLSGSLPSPPSVPSLPSAPATPAPPTWPQISSFPSTSYPPQIPTTPSPTLPPVSSSIPSTPSSPPIPIFYNQNDEIPSQEVVITPAPPTAKEQFVTTLPGPKIAISDQTYNPPPSYAVAYYPNVFYITNEQRLEKISSAQSSGGPSGVSTDGTTDDSSVTSTTSSDTSPTTSEQSDPSIKSQSTVQTLPSSGFTTVYSSNTLDQTKIPVLYNPAQYVASQTPGFYYSSSVVPNVYNVPAVTGITGSYGTLSQAPQSLPVIKTAASSGVYPLPLGYGYGQGSIGYQIIPSTRSIKHC